MRNLLTDDLFPPLARLCFATSHIQEVYSFDDVVTVFRDIIQRVEPTSTGESSRDEHIARVKHLCMAGVEEVMGNVVFRTQDGCLGVASDRIEDDDLVAVTPQLGAPLVFRVSSSPVPGDRAFSN